jgi:D-glycerate 3-kinase
MGMAILEQLRCQRSVAVPRFDKSAWSGEGDRTTCELVTAIDIVLFEGWFVGVRPINPNVFSLAPPPITSEAERVFARDMNVNLQEYCKLWEMLDRLILLYPCDYRLSQQWRRQAEQQMRAKGDGMSDQQIEQFVEYFWKALHPELFIQPLLKQAEWVDLVIEVQPDHSFGAVYKPGRQF